MACEVIDRDCVAIAAPPSARPWGPHSALGKRLNHRGHRGTQRNCDCLFSGFHCPLRSSASSPVESFEPLPNEKRDDGARRRTDHHSLAIDGQLVARRLVQAREARLADGEAESPGAVHRLVEQVHRDRHDPDPAVRLPDPAGRSRGPRADRRSRHGQLPGHLRPLTPPTPRRVAFPAVRLLYDLPVSEETPSRTPWWLLLLRIVAAALVMGGLLWLTAAFAAMVAVHYLLSAIFNSILLFLKDENAADEIWKINFAQTPVTYALSAGAVFLLHALFLEFSLMFGLVILPVTIISHFAFQFHLKRLEQKTREIGEASRIHLATVEALATAIDARDQVGVGHVRRTQIYAVSLGEILGLSADELKALNTGALLHDIGKLAVPDHILNKPGRLTPAEMEKTKIHASVGASILEKVNFNYPVVPTVKYHHECWDGSGYPYGLKGEEIPLVARVLALGDVYDALTSKRCYKEAFTHDASRAIIMTQSGTHFDPAVTEAFLATEEEFKKVREFYTDPLEEM